jgi:hypothetical protein
MKLNELTTPFESFRVVTYNADQTKALYKNKQMQLITGSIYRGETIKEEYNDHCDVYACYAGIPVGIWIGSVHVDYSIEEVMTQIKRKGMETLENYMAAIKYRLEKQDHFRFTEVEFIKHIAPELENQMWESRKVFAENQHKKRMEQAAQREAEDQAFVAERNAEAEQIVNKTLDILRNGGKLENQTVTFYESRYNSSSYSIVNYLMRKYGVNVPIRTQGWINEKLVSAKIEDGKCEHLQYYRAKGAQCSQKFFDCMNELIAKVNAEAA